MVHRAHPHPGHLAAGRPPDVGPGSPSRPAPAAIDAKRRCPRRPACDRVPRLARLYRPGSHQCHLRTARGRGLPARYRPGQLRRPRPAPLGRRSPRPPAHAICSLRGRQGGRASWKDHTPGNLAPRPGQNLRIHHDNAQTISDLAVSLSLGDRCSFRLSNTDNYGYPCTDLTLSSGDALVFGGQARFACHDEPRIYPGTGHPRSGLTRGRINITMRITVSSGQ